MTSTVACLACARQARRTTDTETCFQCYKPVCEECSVEITYHPDPDNSNEYEEGYMCSNCHAQWFPDSPVLDAIAP